MKSLSFYLLPLLCLVFTACPPAPGDALATTAPAAQPNSGAAPAATAPASPAAEGLNTAAARRPRNIILMIGDGMGVTQITAGLYSNGNRLNLEQFPVVGLHKPYSSDNLVTDSAAGATAFSAGVKTYNGAIGVDADTLPTITILELAEAAGLPTGLVSTSSLVHATPASFVAHNRYRKNMEEIAEDFVKAEVDLLIGGGYRYFDRRSKDERKLSAELVRKNYHVDVFQEKTIQQIKPDARKNYLYFTSDAEPLPYAQGRDYLVPASALAPAFLDARDTKNKGFFLMIEGAQIDWGGHANDSEYIISEMLEFDRAIGAVLAFAKKDGETLVIVTADHETGGYAIQTGSKLDSIQGAFTSDYHTAALIPVFAYGPGAEAFGGIYENTAIFTRMRDLLRLE